MNKIFIDCGANRGQSIELFLKNWDDAADFNIYSFECSTSKKLQTAIQNVIKENISKCKSIEYINKAVWIKDEQRIFYDEGNESSSLLIKKTRLNPVLVECIDLSQWIKKTFNPDDFIVLKMDIEGAEYEIFNKLMEDDTLSYINKLYGELHSRKCGKNIEDDIKLVTEIEKHGLKICFWDASNYVKINSNYYTRKSLEATYKRKGWF